MVLVLEQRFLLGRFHATRWNQNPFEDPHGEWPPSPWRLLRALAARWIQYSRETGDGDETARDELLKVMARQPPAFHLPEHSWRGLGVRQYQPTEVAWTDASAKAPAYKKSKTTLAIDHYRALPTGAPVCWYWPELEISNQRSALLKELLRRILYFGRAESLCEFRLVEKNEVEILPNCTLTSSEKSGAPVLVADPNSDLNLSTLLAATDDRLLASRRIPSGAKWLYAKIPSEPGRLTLHHDYSSSPASQKFLQFAVGGNVYPPVARWIKVTQCFRSRAITHRCRQITGGPDARYQNITANQRNLVSLLLGKDGQGVPLVGHRHAYFLLVPDQVGRPTRMVCARKEAFSSLEVEALLAASQSLYAWDAAAPKWALRLVPLPFETPPPAELFAESAVWRSVSPFVAPSRHIRFRRNGQQRPAETTAELVRKLLIKNGYPSPTSVEALSGRHETEWVYIHESPEERRGRVEHRTPAVRPGHYVQIQFSSLVRGPICLGHSCHLGLGLFSASDLSESDRKGAS